MPLLEIRQLQKTYPDGWKLHRVSFTVEDGERLCLLGPSGCGKTTLLRLIAGLELPDDGRVLVDGRDVTMRPPSQRGFGLMFQEYALFPHKDVFGNVAFGLRMQGMAREATSQRVIETLALVGLAGFEHRDVSQLSGGERQRVALARSLAPQPRLLMLDEPLGALDRTLRERLMEELPNILQRANVTTITVTHDQEEAFALADRVVLMRDGRVIQMGTPQDVYTRPSSVWVAEFLGLTNLLDVRSVEKGWADTPLGKLRVGNDAKKPGLSSTERLLLLRPDAARLDVPDHGHNLVTGEVMTRSFRGERYRIKMLHASGIELTLDFLAGVNLPGPGESLTVFLDPEMLVLLPVLGDRADGRPD
ncbi:MAG TPA: ABC transporter ATP-binding protein [Chloroflexi bacterium]|nr:ABC transporter ATP-binding protein [Chloroflexota bacterium]